MFTRERRGRSRRKNCLPRHFGFFRKCGWRGQIARRYAFRHVRVLRQVRHSQSAWLYPGCIPRATRRSDGFASCMWPSCEAFASLSLHLSSIFTLSLLLRGIIRPGTESLACRQMTGYFSQRLGFSPGRQKSTGGFPQPGLLKLFLLLRNVTSWAPKDNLCIAPLSLSFRPPKSIL